MTPSLFFVNGVFLKAIEQIGMEISQVVVGANMYVVVSLQRPPPKYEISYKR